jgi:hypothetical protein
MRSISPPDKKVWLLGRFLVHRNYWLFTDFTETSSSIGRTAGEQAILARTESHFLHQSAQRLAALIFDASVETDGKGIIGADLWAEFRHSGLAMAPFPAELGGAGLSDPGRHNELCAILRLLGSADLSVARIFEGHVNAVSLVRRYGEESQIQEFSSVSPRAVCRPCGAPTIPRVFMSAMEKACPPGQKNSCFWRRAVTDPVVTAKRR